MPAQSPHFVERLWVFVFSMLTRLNESLAPRVPRLDRQMPILRILPSSMESSMNLRPRLYTMLFATALLPVAFAAPASADSVIYTNGQINGAINSFFINDGTTVADSFNVSESSSLTSVDFGVWTIPGDGLSSVHWALTTFPSFMGGSTLFSGTSSVSLVADLGSNGIWDVNLDSFGLGGLSLGPGTYYFELSGAVAPNGALIGWDENNGPSTAYQSALGPIGSEAFTINGTTATPEPGTLILLGTGLLLLCLTQWRSFAGR